MNKYWTYADFMVCFVNCVLILAYIGHFHASYNWQMGALSSLAGLGFVSYRALKYVFKV